MDLVWGDAHMTVKGGDVEARRLWAKGLILGGFNTCTRICACTVQVRISRVQMSYVYMFHVCL